MPDSQLIIPQLRDRLRYYRPSPDRVDAAVLVPVTDEATPHIILTRRASHMSSHAGEVAFPGGKCDSTDASIIATALRESREEIGLLEESVEVIGELDAFTSKVGLRVQPIIGMVPSDLILLPNPGEIESIFRVPVEFFLTEKVSYTHRFRFMGNEVTVPSFNYGDYVIWGLTAFMIVDLIKRAYDHEVDFQWPTSIVNSIKTS
ncbi:MAG: CoA pyrophosphatase [Moraxellaceae bacterium]